MPSSRRAVITGLGVLNPLGLNLDTFWESLCAGRSGVRRLRSFDPTPLPVQFGGEIDGFDARNFLEKKERKRLRMMPRTMQLAVGAAHLAFTDSGLERGKLDPTRFGVIFGSGTVPSDLLDLAAAAHVSTDQETGIVDLDVWGEQGVPCMPPLTMLTHVPNMIACHVSILHNAQGPNNTITQTDLGALLALGEAYHMVGHGRAEVFLVGGADTRMNPVSMVRQCLFAPLSRRNDAPERACRPFDRQRDGLVLGEGSGVVVLEEAGQAERRGAHIHAEVVGFAAAYDRAADGAGLARAIRTALAEAGIDPEDVDHVNAHGSSTIEGDIREARGLHEVFGPRCPVLAAKSYFGSLGAASGTSELSVSLLAFQRNLLPGTLNFEEADPECPVNVSGRPRPVEKPYFLKVSSTELGQCAALVCRKWDPDPDAIGKTLA